MPADIRRAPVCRLSKARTEPDDVVLTSTANAPCSLTRTPQCLSLAWCVIFFALCLRCAHRIGCVAAQGNPLLDISAVVPAEMLTKYGVKPNDAVLAGAANGGTDEQLKVYEVRVNRGAPIYSAVLFIRSSVL